LAFFILAVLPVGAQSDSQLIPPFQLALWNPVQIVPEDDDICGFRLDLIYGENRDVQGIDFGIVNSVTRDMMGAQVGLCNIDRSSMIGIQVGLDNVVGGIPVFGLAASPKETALVNGIQIGALNFVYPVGELNGLQFGLINVADVVRGVQIGLVNCANDMTGFQIGLANVIENAELVFSPIVNACFW
jgi:hypothetical protein